MMSRHFSNGPEFEIAAGKKVGDNQPCFIIAEIGQNHQGDVEIAKQMIETCARAGADCVKFQKSTVLERFNKKCLERPYNTPQSWGKTYGEHKLYLEFSEDEYRQLKKCADDNNVLFSASAWDYKAVDFLVELGAPFIKVASVDAGNLKFIEYLAQKDIPLVISSGMQDMETMYRVYSTVKQYHSNFAFLQCTSAYPVLAENVNLSVIQTYQRSFPDVVIGYSGHESGTSISLAAVAMGARIVERHVTLDKSWKGSDHKASLDMQELASLVKEIRTIETSFGSPEKRLLSIEAPMKRKLGKSLVAVGNLSQGTILTESQMAVKNAEPCGIPPQDFEKVIGAKLKRSLEDDETIDENDVILPERSSQNDSNKLVALILARKGSKGIPGKNIKLLNGHPLVAWTILAVKKSSCFDEIWVSTDCPEIGRISQQYGARYHDRDPSTAQDLSKNQEGYKDFLQSRSDIWAVAHFQCTFPAQQPKQIFQAVQMLKQGSYDSVFGASRSHKFRWSAMDSSKFTVPTSAPLNFNPANRPRRQDWQGEIVETGAYYMFTVKAFNQMGFVPCGRVGYVVDEDADDIVDIDNPHDFARAEILIQSHIKKIGLSEIYDHGDGHINGSA